MIGFFLLFPSFPSLTVSPLYHLVGLLLLPLLHTPLLSFLVSFPSPFTLFFLIDAELGSSWANHYSVAARRPGSMKESFTML